MNYSSNKNQINIFNQNQKTNFTSGNPFGNMNDTIKTNIQNDVNVANKSSKRLNGYDSNILNKANFEKNEQELGINYRIKEKETLLKELDEKIKIADDYGTQNESLGLKAKKQRILQELSSLHRQQVYGNGNEDVFHHKLKHKMPVLYKIQDFISRHILSKISKKFNSVVALSDSLEQLSDISKSVDELIDMNVPYGEKLQNYEKLTEYLSRANVIHSKISKSLKR